jgi:hypothetical protein
MSERLAVGATWPQLSRKCSIFGQKVQAIVPGYRAIGVFSSKKPVC